jgi:hypothetical protein
MLFCTLDHIIVEPPGYFPAASFLIQDAKGKTTGATLVLNQTALEGNLTMSDDQLRAASMCFDKGTPIKVTAPEVPNVSTVALYSIAHEFGHLLDAYNQSVSLINPQGCVMDTSPYTVQPCPAPPGTWMALSWTDARTSIFDSMVYPLRSKTFGPFPHGNPLTTGPLIASSMVDETYDELYKSTFMSYLGGFTPYDDWAESVAFTIYASHIQDPEIITTPSGKTYKPIDHLNSSAFAAKKSFVLSVLGRTDVSTPR